MAVLSAVAFACDARDTATSETTVRDSAGVRITTLARSPESLPTLSLDSLPVVRLDGSRAPYFQNITSGTWTSADEVVVLDRQADLLHVFSAGGALLRTLGGPGEGPGEFGNVATLTVAPGDSIFVFDRAQDRVSVFHARDGFARDVALRTEGAGVVPIDVWAIAPDRFALYSTAYSLEWEEDYDGRPFVLPSEDRLSMRDGVGAPVGGPVVVPGAGLAQFAWGSGGLPLAASPEMAGAAGRVLLGRGSAWDITVFDADLRAVAILRWPTNREPVTGADRAMVEAHIRETLAPFGPDRIEEIVQVSLSDEAVPELRPAHGRLVAGTDGSVWVSRFEPYAEEDRWTVFAEDGTPAGRVVLPQGARLLAADLGRVLLVRRDSLDVPSVEVWRLRGP